MRAAPTKPPRSFRAGGRPWRPLLGLALWAWPLAAQAPPKPALQTVGSEICQACHEDVYKAFQGTPHARLDKDARRGWQGKACESCHGPGSAHAESGSAADIRNPAKIAPAESDRMCLGCHLNQPTQVGRIQGGHARGQVACVNCHSIHKPRAETVTSAKAALINQSCAACHVSSWAEFQKPHRHRLPEGAMSCVDCHNPHGSLLSRSLQTVSSNEPGCLKCHGDKRGPFTFEHASVRVEGCTACHQPHGSANPRMLTRHEVRFVCLECHSNLPVPGAGAGGVPAAFHDLRSPRFRNCTTCHVKIHGSYIDRAFLR